MMATEVVVPDVPVDPRAELIAKLAACNATAKRQFPVIGTTKQPSGWDIAHARLNYLLTELVGA